MEDLFLYLLKANLALAVLYGLYFFFFRQLTFYTFNRWYLWFALLFASVYPTISISWLTAKQKASFMPAFSADAVSYWAIPTQTITSETGIEYSSVFMLLLGAGAVVLFIRLVLQFSSLHGLHRKSIPAQHKGQPYRKVPEVLDPFSFWKTIYANPTPFTAEELNVVLQHEQVHVRQSHTLDILLAEILTVLAWYNPVAWKMRHSIKENLEFLADHQLVTMGVDRKFYQYSLLRAVSPSSLLVVHPFNTIPLKNRIKMMNQPQSPRRHLFKAFLALPLIGGLLLASQTESLSEIPDHSLFQDLHASTADSPARKNQALAEKDIPSRQNGLTPQQQYEAFLKRNPNVKGLGWDKETLFVYLKSGEVEKYPSTPAGTAAAEKKYGSLPVPPPPPPPAPAAEQAPPPPPVPAAGQAPPPPPPPYRNDLPAAFKKRNPTVKGVTRDEGTIYVILTSGKVETFDNTAAGLAALEKKYGKLPAPPPPKRVKKDLPPPPPPVRATENKLMPPVIEKDHPNGNAQDMPQDYKAFLARNPKVSHLYWTENSLHVVLQSGANDAFPKSAEGMKEAEKKYGSLPAVPAKPPLKDMPIPQKAKKN